jgi:hypothetical protein
VFAKSCEPRQLCGSLSNPKIRYRILRATVFEDLQRMREFHLFTIEPISIFQPLRIAARQRFLLKLSALVQAEVYATP